MPEWIAWIGPFLKDATVSTLAMAGAILLVYGGAKRVYVWSWVLDEAKAEAERERARADKWEEIALRLMNVGVEVTRQSMSGGGKGGS